MSSDAHHIIRHHVAKILAIRVTRDDDAERERARQARRAILAQVPEVDRLDVETWVRDEIARRKAYRESRLATT